MFRRIAMFMVAVFSNAAIDCYANAVIKTLDEPYVRFVSTDQQEEKVKPISESLVLNGNLDLHKAVYSEMVQRFNSGKLVPLKLTTFCEAPAGSGLDSSSTLVVVMIRGLAELLNSPLDDYTIPHLAFKIVRVDCDLQGGRQDQYLVTLKREALVMRRCLIRGDFGGIVESMRRGWDSKKGGSQDGLDHAY